MTLEEQRPHPLHVLMVEDSVADFDTVSRLLTDCELQAQTTRVDTPEALSSALANGFWDLLLSDTELRCFPELQPLDFLRQSGRDIPLILLSGRMNDDVAAAALKSGARDCVSKDRLERLIPIFERELREASIRRAGLNTAASLREMKEQLGVISTASKDAIVMIDSHQRITFWSHPAERMFGHSSSRSVGRDLLDLLRVSEKHDQLKRLFQEALDLDEAVPGGRTLELTGHHLNGGEIQLEVTLSTVLVGGRWLGVVILKDITQSRALEREWIEQVQFLQTVIETIPNPDAHGRKGRLFP